MNYLVVEMQTNNGTTSTLNYQYSDLKLAQQKYFTILAAAVVSSVDVHTAFIVDETGVMLTSDSYGHIIASNEN